MRILPCNVVPVGTCSVPVEIKIRAKGNVNTPTRPKIMQLHNQLTQLRALGRVLPLVSVSILLRCNQTNTHDSDPFLDTIPTL